MREDDYSRTRGERRKNDYTKAIRKKRIAEVFYRNPWHNCDGKYIKGKVHCSCPLCAAKTNERNLTGVSNNWKHSDAVVIDGMKAAMKEYNSYRDYNQYSAIE